MMLTDAFLPTPLGTRTVTVTGAAQTVALPDGEFLELQNADAAAVFFVETTRLTGTTPVLVAAVATGYPILPGQSKVIRRRPGDSSLSVIGAAGGTLYVSGGVGT
jgi:hypothetical protein